MIKDMTLKELASDYSFNFNCNVNIYDCTPQSKGEEITWHDLPYPSMSTNNCNPSEIMGNYPHLLDMFVRYITIDIPSKAIVIEVVESMG